MTPAAPPRAGDIERDATTTPDLSRLTADLPVDRLGRHDPRRRAAARRGVQIHLAGYLTMVVVVLTVWLAVGLSAGAWYFWPVWPILGAGIGLAAHALPARFALPACPPPRRNRVPR